MFKLLRSYLQKSDDKISQREKFRSVCRAALELAESNPRDLYILIKILGRNIQYNYFSEFIKHAGVKGLEEHTSRHLTQPKQSSLWIDAHDKNVSPKLRDWIMNEVTNNPGDKAVTVDLAKDIVLPWPWNYYRFKGAVENIGKKKPWGPWSQDESNHMLMCWEPIGICFVGGGNHSLMAGIVNQEGVVKSHIVNEMDAMYEVIMCGDGESYSFQDNERWELASKVQNLDFALIYEIGRILQSKGIKYWT